MCSAIQGRMRPGGEFFAQPSDPIQRRYEALRAYLYEGRPAAEVAKRFGYRPATVIAIARDFRAGERAFFLPRRPGPKRAPRKEAARAAVVALRRRGHSLPEIVQALAASQTPLNRTGVWEILREEGFERLALRPAAERGGPRRERQGRVGLVGEWSPRRVATDWAGALLLVPELVALGLPAAVARAGLPGTTELPALASVLALVALKAAGRRRVSHVEDVAQDAGLGLVAGLDSLPKATALQTYSHRTTRAQHEAFLAGLLPGLRATGLVGGESFDLDFHAVPHFGADPALEPHYVPRRSQRVSAVLTFFAQDGETGALCYANADLTVAERAAEVVRFARFWEAETGTPPALLVFDSQATTGAMLAELDRAGISFLTLRKRGPKLTAELAARPKQEWTKVRLERPGRYRAPEVTESEVQVSGCSVPLRQLAVRGLGRDEPTLLLTNERAAKPKALIERYAKRMTIENSIASLIRTFHLDSLTSAVALNVDLDVAITVATSAAYRSLARRLRTYESATAETIHRRFIATRGEIRFDESQLVVRLVTRAYTPILRSAEIPQGIEVPWWGGRRLVFEFG